MAASLLTGCALGLDAGTSPGEPPPVEFRRSQTLKKAGVTVQVAIPTEEEAARHFGVDFAKNNIQPIWLRIENDSDFDYWLLPIAIDRDYYSADEAAIITGAKDQNGQDAVRGGLFRTSAMPYFLKSGSTNQGYVYATHARGGRFVDVRLSGSKRAIRLRFAVLLPTESFDYEHSPVRTLYARVHENPDLTLPQLRERLRGMLCCTSRSDGSGEGDPLNVVLVGSGEDALAALVASGWGFTETISVESIRRMIGAAIAKDSFLTAPVSPLYTFGRKQDVALQRGRATISRRIHMRLWLAPFLCEGKPVWVGQVSRDIGVKVTSKSPTLTTHVIDPVVDEAREYLFHSLLQSEAISRFAFVRGVGESTHLAPRFNLTGDSYFSDGMRLVVWLSSDPVAPHEAEDLGWNPSADPIREGRGEDSSIPPLLDP